MGEEKIRTLRPQLGRAVDPGPSYLSSPTHWGRQVHRGRCTSALGFAAVSETGAAASATLIMALVAVA